MGDDFLASMAYSSRLRAEAAETNCSREALLAAIADTRSPPPLILSKERFDLIAEVKLRSPAAGVLRERDAENIGTRARLYSRAGAAAISILTEPSRFDGEMDHLREGVAALDAIPAMRKDFLVNDYQVLEARAAGAGGVLLIVRMLSIETLIQMVKVALDHQLFVLLEVFDEQDIAALSPLLEEIATKSKATDPRAARLLVGVNCRDLTTLQVVPERLFQLVSQLPKEWPKVAESGLETAQDAARLAAAGYDLALVGSALMRTASPLDLARDMLSAGRLARGVST